MFLSILKEFLKRFLPVALLAVTVAFLLNDYQGDVLKREVAIKEESLVLLQKEIAETTLSTLLSDVFFLTQLTKLHLKEHSDKRAFLRELADEFKSLSESRDVYDQVRYIDRSGMELVRINLTPEGALIVPEEKLQNKGNRYYFKKGLREKAEVYISRLDLNVEHGSVEKPFKPMLRFSSPVLSERGEIRGVIVLNYLGVNLLDSLRRAAKESDSMISLVNSDGYWLIGPDSSEEWGFMFEGGQSKSMAFRFPEEWRKINSSGASQVETDKGLFIFKTVYPLKDGLKSVKNQYKGEAEENWKIISHVTPDRLLPRWTTTVYGATALFLIIFGLTNWRLTAAKLREKGAVAALEKSEKEVRTLNEELEERVKDRTAELEMVNQNLKESTEIFQSITSTALSAIVMINDNGDIIFWNEAAESIFGWKKEEITGENILNTLVPPKYNDLCEKQFPGFKKTGHGLGVGMRSEASAMRKDGKEIPIQIALSSVEIIDNWNAVGIINDITELKILEEEREKTVEQLERFSRLAHGREKKMIELKKEINELLVLQGKGEKYKIVE